MFSGQIPFEVSKLSQLSSLDLWCSYDLFSDKYFLLFNELSLTSLVGNLTRIENLDLSGVNIFSTVPNIFANLSNLRTLYLHDCGMHGEFPPGIFKLPNLRVLDVSTTKISLVLGLTFNIWVVVWRKLTLEALFSQVSYPFLWETSAPWLVWIFGVATSQDPFLLQSVTSQISFTLGLQITPWWVTSHLQLEILSNLLF